MRVGAALPMFNVSRAWVWRGAMSGKRTTRSKAKNGGEGADEGVAEKKKPAGKVRRVSGSVAAEPATKVQKPEPLGDPNEATGSNDDIPKDFSAHYLIKSEPNDYSVDDLAKEPDQTTCWEGVRNARARNILQAMRTGQSAFFYQSACKTPGVVGIVKIVKEAYPDDTQFDPKSKYYDAKSTKERPKWFMVDIQLVRKLKRMVSLEELKKFKTGDLRNMQLFTTARLSVQNVTDDEWDHVLTLEKTPPP